MLPGRGHIAPMDFYLLIDSDQPWIFHHQPMPFVIEALFLPIDYTPIFCTQ